MKKIRFSLLLVASVAGLCNVAFAQSVEQGTKFLYYHRFKSAGDIFDKLLASNPNNIEAIYWKGQTLFDLRDSTGACDLYSKALQTNGNAPMLLVGMGGCELRMGKTQDARQRFETAISLSKGKDIPVLNAIADNNIDAPQGDAQYAIEKLTLATQIKKFNDATTFVLMGDAYRKLIDGGNAVTSYQKALSMDPKLAEAKYKIGRIYESQNNPEFFLPAFTDAIQLDPNYAPAYEALYVYYFNHGDVAKTKDYLDKYIAVTDPSSELEYEKTSIIFLDKNYDQAIAASKSAISTLGDKADPKYYKLIAYSYDAKGDSTNALDYLNQYFAKQRADQLIPMDFIFLGKEDAKFPADSAASVDAYQKAITMDTVLAEKLQYLKQAADDAKAAGHKQAYAFWLGIQYPFIKNPNQSDLYNWGIANYQAGNYKSSDSIFCGTYETKYPDEVYGYLWCMRSKAAQDDSVGSQGVALEAEMKLAEFGRAKDSIAKAAGTKDSTLYQKYVVDMYSRLAFYYNNIKSDKVQAVFWLRKILEVEPSNGDAAKYIEMLTRPPRRPAAPAAKPKTGAGGKERR